MTDTICALASGPPPSAISIIRVSGPNVPAIVDRHLGGALRPRLASRRSFRDSEAALIDECLAVSMPGPNSYTGEDILELFLHGGRAVVDHAIGTLTGIDGVRLAEAGEFTRRAFEAGKLDLLEAEGVADAIDAETRAQKDQALRQLGGALSETYAGWRASLLQALALLEAAIDFPDEDDAPDSINGPVYDTIRTLSNEIEAALADDHVGERIRDGFRITIVGPPNAGKSSLLNHFAGRSAAIVTDIPGTTRDVVEVRRVIAGAVVWFLDTAGLRETEDIVEAEGVRRAKAVAEEADLRLHIIDGVSPAPPEGDVRIEDLLIFNKADLAGDKPLPDGTISISATTGAGLDQLDQKIADWVAGKVTCNEPALITRQRHRAGLASGLESLKAALGGLESGMGAELVAEDVRLATRSLDALLGTVGVEDVLGAVFSQFCIGK